MRKSFLFAAILSLALIASYSAYSCGPGGSSSSKKGGSASVTPGSTEEESPLLEFANVYAVDEGGSKYAVCPVSGSSFKVSENNSFSKVAGKGYYYCCAGCEKPFQADLEKYLGEMKKKMAEAKERFEKGQRPDESRM